MPSGSKYARIPRYFGLRIYLISSLMYFFLVFPVVGILFFRYVPDYIIKDRQNTRENNVGIPGQVQETGQGTSEVPLLTDTSQVRELQAGNNIADTTDLHQQGISMGNSGAGSQIGGTIFLLMKLLLACFIIGFAFNLPFKIYFRHLRKRREPSAKLTQFCKKFLLKTPLINSGILLIAFGITILYTLFNLLFTKDLNELNRQFYLQYFFITLVSSFLTLMLVYFWQKHRVHIRYLEHVYGMNELKKRIFRIKRGRIRNRLLISSALTTLVPLVIVLFYLVLSITSVKELGINELTSDQQRILLGKYITMNLGYDADSISNLFYVNVINSLLMVLGIISGVTVALIYLVLFIRWTTEDITRPVRELLASMDRTGRGELDSFSIVRTDDEIGELTEGYNRMSERLNNYFQSLSNINKANSRFVPKQFLEYLGKDSIIDIQLGDQVQKEMTILFSDIRDFTSISEMMTPKQNFDYLNSYLGYMEPVIRLNTGFIDKFMGDSIMALFPDKPEDAINASIEMRIKLLEFNEVMKQFDKPLINSGIGVHTGLLMLGVIGGEGRMDGTVISDAVNLSSRVEGLTKIYGSSIIITEDTLIKLNDPSHYQFRFLDVVKVKGKKEAVYVFEILDGDNEESKKLKIKTKEDYGRAIQAYKKRDFSQSLAILQKIDKVNPDDKVIKLYMQRCNHYIKTGVPDHWDGAENIENKI